MKHILLGVYTVYAMSKQQYSHTNKKYALVLSLFYFLGKKLYKTKSNS